MTGGVAQAALDFSGKVVLVTGAGVGIGRAIADAFADAGARVFAVEIDEHRADALSAARPAFAVIRADICARETPALLAKQLEIAGGRLDVLVNNVGHFLRPGPFATPSYAANGSGEYFLGTSIMQWFWDQYLGATPVQEAPLAAVLHTPSLAGLPPATVITAESDPLRDEGMAYAARLAEAGTPVDAAVAPGMIHGFISMFEAVPDACAWIDHAGERLHKALS